MFKSPECATSRGLEFFVCSAHQTQASYCALGAKLDRERLVPCRTGSISRFVGRYDDAGLDCAQFTSHDPRTPHRKFVVRRVAEGEQFLNYGEFRDLPIRHASNPAARAPR